MSPFPKPLAVMVVVMVVVALAPNVHAGSDAGKRLLELRTRADDANFRNDAAQLRALSQQMSKLTADPDVGAFALYDAGWTEWALFNAEFQARRMAEASAAVTSSLDRFRRLVVQRPDDAEAQAMLANALIAFAYLAPERFRTVGPELAQARRAAVELGPRNPRVVLMDAGVLFNTPAEKGGSQEKGLQRWLVALDLFEAEARTPPANPLAPRWGRALAHGWMSDLYLAMKPPRIAEARKSAAAALSLRPDFWYVKERVLPRLKD